jgi:methionine-rich copper-binding protein CopC
LNEFKERSMSLSRRAAPRLSTIVVPAIALVLALGAAVAFPTAAFAHAKPTSSTPSPNENLTAAPTTVTIIFGQNVKPDGSDIIVYDKDGKKVSTAPATVDPNDLKKMTVPMQGTDSESYLVVWHTVSADDGESAIGSFSFGVNAAADDLPSGTTTAPSASSGVQPWLAALIGVIGLILGGVGGYYFARRQTTPAKPTAQ